MTCTPCLKCKITPNAYVIGRVSSTSNLKGTISSSGYISAKFSLPTQVDAEKFSGPYVYTPSWTKQIIHTANKLLEADIEINKIQTYETSNEYGTTFII